MSRLLCLTELLRRLAGQQRAAGPGSPPEAPGADLAYKDERGGAHHGPLTWDYAPWRLSWLSPQNPLATLGRPTEVPETQARITVPAWGDLLCSPLHLSSHLPCGLRRGMASSFICGLAAGRTQS